MNISMQLTVVVVAVCLCLAEGAPDGRMVRKQQRPTRGFKNVEMMTARGFGKRDRPHTRTEQEEIRVTRGTFRPSSKILIARGYGKRVQDNERVVDMDDFLEALATSEKEGQEIGEEKTVESMPLELLVLEMMNNPDFTRSVVRKFIDINQDGQLSLDELLRNVA